MQDGFLGTAKFAVNVADRAALTAAELASVGAIGPGWHMGDIGSGYGDAFTTIGHAIRGVAEQVNPFNTGSMYYMPGHLMAYYESLAAAHGWGYALGQMVPSALAAMTTDGILADGQVAVSAEADAANVARARLAQMRGEKLTKEDLAAIERSRQRLVQKRTSYERSRRLSLMSTRRKVVAGVFSEDAAKQDAMIVKNATDLQLRNVPLSNFAKDQLAKAQERIAERERIKTEISDRRKYPNEFKEPRVKSTIIDEAGEVKARRLTALSKSLTYVYKPLESVGALRKTQMEKTANKLNMQAAYATGALSAQGDPKHQKLWELTRGGHAVDANLKPMGTDGQMIAQYLGMDKNNMMFSPVSGLTDFYTNWIGADPFSVAGRVIGQARKFEGFSGYMGHMGNWFGGMGIRLAEDVDRVFKQYSRVSRAFEYMATHNASEIANEFRNSYSKEVLNKLGEAKSVEEVMQIHRELAEAVGFTRNMAPSMSMYLSLIHI